MQKTFVQAVESRFQFLVDEFGFNLLSSTASPRRDPWEGDVQYITRFAFVDVNCARGELPSIWIGRAIDKKKHLLPLQVIYEFRILSGEEKNIVLSHSVGQREVALILQKRLSNLLPDTKGVEEGIDLRLVTYARLLREFGLPLLRGDFSQWLELWEYHIEKLSVESARAGRPEYVPIVETDDQGKLKVIGKKHLFQQGKDYISDLHDDREKYHSF